MKRILLIIALLISGLGLNAQDHVSYVDYDVMTTTYDLQSNGFVANRMYQLKDGTVALTATMSNSLNDASFTDRGTGYNFYNGTTWNENPTSCIEDNATGADMRTGWPSIAPYGAEGEILVNHSTGLNYWIRTKAGEGVWDGPYAIPNPEGVDEVVGGWNNVLAWPRIVTTGENNEVLHVFAAASGEVTTAQYYLRTTDLQNWDIQFAPTEMDGLHVGFYAADDYAVSANGENIAVVYNNWEKAHTMLYESNDGGLSWESRIVWENPIHGLDWETDENSLFEKLYAPAQVSVAIGRDGVSHVALGVGLYDRTGLGNSYSLYMGLITDGVAYWNDTITRWEGVPSPIRSSQDDELKHALRLWWPNPEDPDVIVIDTTNFCAWIPNYNEFESSKQYTGTYAGTAGDYLVLFGLIAYPSIAVDPAGNIAVAYSAPDLTRFTKDGYYYRSMYVSYKAANSKEWQVGNNLYQTVKSNDRECVFVSAVSTPVSENEFWFSCLSDDTPGFYANSNPSQANISTSVVSAFKFTPEEEYKTFNISASVQPESTGVVTGVGSYRENEIATLKAIPNMGCMFVNWTENGEVVSTDAEYTFVATEDRNLVANFDGELQYIVTSNSPAECQVVSMVNKKETSVTIPSTIVFDGNEYTVTSIGDNAFKDCINLIEIEIPSGVTSIGYEAFSGCSSLTSIYCYAENVPETSYYAFDGCHSDMVIYVPAISVNAYKAASPWKNYTIISLPCVVTASVNPEEAGVITGTGEYELSDTVTLTATANKGYRFVSWTENGVLVSIEKEFSFVVTTNRNFVANFEKTYEITATVNPEKVGVVIGSGVYFKGDNVTLTAIAMEGYKFVNWTEDGEVVSENAQYSFVVEGNRNLIANFDKKELVGTVTYNVTTTVNPEKVGVVIGSGLYFKGDNVTLTAIPIKNGYEFVNWTEDGEEVSTDAQYSFVIESDRDLVANFVLLEYYVSAAVSSAEAGEVTGDGNYNHGDTVALIATANTGYKFVNWTENGVVVSEDAQYSFVILKDRELTANFVETTGVEELSMSFNIYPNPVNDMLYIETEVEIERVVVYDAFGRQQTAVNGQQGVMTVEVSNLNAGVYFVMIKTNDGVVTKRFVKI